MIFVFRDRSRVYFNPPYQQIISVIHGDRTFIWDNKHHTNNSPNKPKKVNIQFQKGHTHYTETLNWENQIVVISQPLELCAYFYLSRFLCFW